MPIYEYEHVDAGSCPSGKRFEILQSMSDAPLTRCPKCRSKVHKLFSAVHVNMPKTNSELKDLGFTKLVRRDDGVYENVTARGKDKQLVIRDKPETLPDLRSTIRD